MHHRTVSGAPRESNSELASFGNPLRYNSSDMSGEPAEQRLLRAQRSTATHLMRACARKGAEHERVAHRTVYRTCLVHHRTARRAHKSELQRSEPSGRMTWLAHRTVWCAMRQQPPPNGWFGGWGYKYPQPPHIQVIQVFPLQLLTRALAFNSRHTQVIKSSPNSTQSFSDK